MQPPNGSRLKGKCDRELENVSIVTSSPIDEIQAKRVGQKRKERGRLAFPAFRRRTEAV